MENVSANPIQGSMYGFANVRFSDKVIATATEKGMTADTMYCLDMVNETGIMTVPGSGFG
jgi:alanine transaminase